MVLSSYFGRHFGGSCDDQAFGRMKFPMTGQAFGFSNSRIGIGILKCYRKALIGYLEIGDDLGGQIVFWSSWDYFVLRKSFIFLDFFQITIAKHVYQIILFSDTFIHFI
ncbi:uncharacterized protein OCT59_020275 [Rhizophagus irregularis]|uniref:uncharacterized protein n=1 Tax=Rhizophagus irregularis TaxID=588596 RepID=UPI0033342BE2|nr:hypothetical protein OCT59_020275 [Rhizophagus irregularis]